MASVNLAALKISGVLLGFDREATLLVCATVTVIYAASSGLRGVVLTDVVQFGVAMVGAVLAAWYALAHPAVGGLAGLLSNPEVARRTAMLPDFGDWRNAVMVFVIPVTVQWWSTWYPGAEPGGGGYVAQRMLAARNEKESLLSVLLFNVLHYGLRPWPWILVALASLVVYPDLAAIQARFPHLDPRTLGNDLGYPAMLVFLPAGLLGLMLASLAAAYMSTISTHLNWGASYVVEDWYRRFVARDRSERHYVAIARVATVVLVALAAVVSLALESAFRTFAILLQIGAGTGLIYLLRWYWWRVNAWSEIAGMVISFAVAVYFEVLRPRMGLPPMDAAVQLVIGVAITTVGWLAVTFLTPPTDAAVLRRFHDRIRPGGPGWRRVAPATPDGGGDNLPAAFLCWFLGVTLVYAAMFAIGSLLYGEVVAGLFYSAVAAASGTWLFRTLPRVGVL